MTTAQTLASLGSTLSTSSLGFRNRLMNADFKIGQRGSSAFAMNSSNWTYGPDRWAGVCPTGAGAGTIQCGLYGGVGSDTESNNCLIYTQTAGGTLKGAIMQRIESGHTLAGRRVTLSVMAYSTSGTPALTVTVVQNFGTGGSPSAEVTVISDVALGTMSTAHNVYTLTFDIPSVTGKTFGTTTDGYLHVAINTPASGTFNVVIVKAQLEEGSVATPFEVRPHALELLMCQRYYQAIFVKHWGYTTAGQAVGSTISYTPMRVSPSTATSGVSYGNASGLTLESVTQYSTSYYAAATTQATTSVAFTLTLTAEL